MTYSFTLPRWFDAHVHLRQGNLLTTTIADQLSTGCASVLAMPNTKPPITRISGPSSETSMTLSEYHDELMNHGADAFENLILPLYLCHQTTPILLEQGVREVELKACKYYPPKGTTNADHGAPIEHYIKQGIFETMKELGIVLCLHGESHSLSHEQYFDQHINAEKDFYLNTLPRLIDKYPALKIVCEHITTKEACDLVSSADANVAATITPQHLLFTVGHLLRGFNYHLYCLPLLKFEEDRAALRQAIITPNQTHFFAGTDSAPHTHKTTDCGCAAGCYTAPVAPNLYAMAFEAAGCEFSSDSTLQLFKNFMSTNGCQFYGLAESTKTFTMTKTASELTPRETNDGTLVPLPTGLNFTGTEHLLSWSVTI